MVWEVLVVFGMDVDEMLYPLVFAKQRIHREFDVHYNTMEF